MRENQFTVPANTDLTQDLQCPTNMVVTGGGVTLLSQPLSINPTIESSGPINSITWEVRVGNDNSLNSPFTYGEWIICAIAG